MSNIKFLMVLCILGIAGKINAQQQVSKEEATNAAINTLRNKTDVLKVSLDDRIKTVNSLSNGNRDTIMYEVVFQNGATVLLSGSKSCLPVLGYYVKGDNGSVFDPNNDDVPCGLKALLKDYIDEIEWSFTQDTISLYHEEKWQELQQFHRGGEPPLFIHVDTLLTTKWGQRMSNRGNACPAYNYYVTKQKPNQCGGYCNDVCPVGCTAVAMGQIMNYWKYPVGQFDWCNMSNELNTYFPFPPYDPNPDYEKQRNAIARLLKDCAESVNAQYCIGLTCQTSATAIDARSALVKDFDYSSNAVFRLRSSHPINLNNVWIDYLRTNLNAGRPVLYGALGEDAHYWVCDGYGDDGNGNSHENVYFHFNFGHIGEHDGWYTVNNITANPHYNSLQEAVFDIYPSTNENYCNYTFSLDDHFAAGGTHQNVPKTYMKLETASATSPAAWRTIQSGQSAEYVAHEKIVLKSGFKAEAGSYFKARIEPCVSCGSTTKSTLLLAHGGDTSEYNNFYNFNDTTLHKSIKNNLQEEANPQNKEVNIIPNPNNGTFTLHINFNPQEVVSVQVFSIVGQRIYKQDGLPNTIIQLPATAKGMFFVEICTQSERFVRKMVVN